MLEGEERGRKTNLSNKYELIPSGEKMWVVKRIKLLKWLVFSLEFKKKKHFFDTQKFPNSFCIKKTPSLLVTAYPRNYETKSRTANFDTFSIQH